MCFLTNSECSFTASEKEQNMMPNSASVSLNVVATDTESITASTATPVSLSVLVSEIPSFSKVANNSGSTSSRDLGLALCFGAE